MKVLLNDGMKQEGKRLFEDTGIVVEDKHRDLDTLIGEIPEFDALTVRSKTKVTRDVIESGARGKLKIIGRAGVGYDNIDLIAASENGILVKFAPHGNTNSTAEHALALMFAVARNVTQSNYHLRNGVWLKKPFEGTELSGKTLGIIGCGRIGQRLAELTGGFMKVLGYDPDIDSVKANFPTSRIDYIIKEDVLKSSDFISIHASKGLVLDFHEFNLMKPTAYVINVARGACVCDEALYDALTKGKIAGAGLDVHSKEPKNEGDTFGTKLKDLENCVLTPHLGASTREAQIKTSMEMARVVIDYLEQGDFTNAVNVGQTIEAEGRQVYPVYICHKDAPGVFGKIDNVFGKRGVNIRENKSRSIGDGNAMTVYLVQQEIGKDVVESLRGLSDIQSVRI